jgi:small subunit ribosomal protein S5
VALNRVTKVTKGGRTFTFAAIVVVGNENGVVGHGLGKAKEVQEAIAKGIDDAKKNLVKVPVRKGTIPHTQEGKFAGAQVLLKPAAHGTGVIAGGAMRAVLESVGVTDVLAKSKGSSNPHNVVKATIEALPSMRDANTVSRAARCGNWNACSTDNGTPGQRTTRTMSKIIITQTKSQIKCPKRQKDTLKAPSAWAVSARATPWKAPRRCAAWWPKCSTWCK